MVSLDDLQVWVLAPPLPDQKSKSLIPLNIVSCTRLHRARLGLLSLWIFCRNHSGDPKGPVRNGMPQWLSVGLGGTKEQFAEKDRANERPGDAPIGTAGLLVVFYGDRASHSRVNGAEIFILTGRLEFVRKTGISVEGLRSE